MLSSRFTDSKGTTSEIVYQDADSFVSLDASRVRQAYGACFYGDKLLIVLHGQRKTWSLPGGTMKPGESFEECLRREVAEESNMKILTAVPIGYQEVKLDSGGIFQLRYACTVEPIGPFVKDSDDEGGIIEIKLIDPLTYRDYLHWGAIGDRIISRALELTGKKS